MRKSRIVAGIAAILFLFAAQCAAKDWSDKAYVDEELKEIEAKIEKEAKECEKTATGLKIMRHGRCISKIRKKYHREGFLRGSEEYCRKNYGHLSFKQLEKKFRELEKLRKTIRRQDGRFGDEMLPGEVTSEDFQNESWWVENRLAQMQRTRMDEIEKSFNKKDLNK